MKGYLPFVIIALVGLIALSGGSMLYRSKRAEVTVIPKGGTPPERQAEKVHARGPADAPVTLPSSP
jgi:hypothetical protein